MSSQPQLALHDLAIGARDRWLLADYSAIIPKGAIHAIVTPDPALCLQLADTIAGFQRPARGRIEIDGRDLALRGPGRRGIMSVRADPALFPGLTGYGNIAFPLEQQRHGTSEIRRRVETLAAEIGLTPEMLASLPDAMLPETRIGIALARALAAEPALLLLERPLQSLPAPARTAYLPELRRLLRQFRITTLLVSDDLGEAMIGADEISVVMGGREVQRDGPDAIFRRPANATIARLGGAGNLLPVTVSASNAEGEGTQRIEGSMLQGGGVTLPRERNALPIATGPALMLVRPEAVRLFLGIRRFDVLAEGVIADVMPHRTGAQIRVALDHFPRGMLADVTLPAPMPLEFGRRATLGWNRADFHLLPPETTTDGQRDAGTA
jgi:ABC-type Fe3+/spermidine/putrescine transport system ATPase subunit